MDGLTKMPFKQGHSDEDMMYFRDLYASPAKSDASSVDIYDGLDTTTLTEQAVEKSSPSRTCLDLYEEILTEEGTAKETSFNDLSGEYEKCQKQIKQLITRLKEMKSMNSSLQNENQCLKKNISALIKTARVEITRKEDEINRLNQRLGMPGMKHSFKPTQIPLMNINNRSQSDDLSKNIRNTENLPKKNITLQSKDITSHYSKNLCDQEKSCVKSSPTCPPVNKPISKQCKDSIMKSSHVEPPCFEANDTNKIQMGLDNLNKVTERNRTKERPKSSSANLVSENSDLKEKVRRSPLKCGRNDSSQEKRNSKSEAGSEIEDRKYHSISYKEKMQLKDLDSPKEKEVRKYERSPHRRESRAYEKEKNTESRHKTSEKIEEPRRSKRTHFSTSKDDGSHKFLEQNDGKRSLDTGRKDKRSSEYNESKHGNKDSKQSRSENSPRNKPNRDNRTERSDREKRGDEKKRSRDDHDQNKHDRKDKMHETKVKDTHQSSSKGKGSHSKVNEKSKNGDKIKVDSGQKDLKLSFMETLNLTLSPAKKTPDDAHRMFPVASSKDCEVEESIAKSSSPQCVTENHVDSLCPQQTDLKHSELVSLDNRSTKVLNIEDSNQASPSEPVVEMKVQPNTAVENHLVEKLTIDDKQLVSTDLHTVDLEVMDMHSPFDGSDLIDLDSFIEIDRCSGSPSSETPNMSTPAEQTQDISIVEPSEEDDQAMKLKSNQTPKGICESPDTDLVHISTKGIENKHCFHDEGSIDFNVLRHIPKLLSPLKSPARPKALHTLERTAKASVVSNLHKELLPETNVKSTCLSPSDEINKENCQPDNKLDFGCKIPAVACNDELEEGEILSEEEQMPSQTIQPISNAGQLVPDHITSVTKSQSGQDGERLSNTEKTIMLPEKSATKKKTKIATQSKLSALPTSKQGKLSADCCLDGILKIVTPSSTQDVLQMLRIIRKHIRNKYMKFKIQFPLTQFHRIIEAATLYFITLVRNLDWCCICSSPERLQKKLCRQIETRLKKLKKNGIVDRIFEQHLLDMKKRLWKFVEEQLDSLFDILKVVIVKLCDKAEVEKDTESCTNTQKSGPVTNSQNKRSKHVGKHTLPESGSLTCLRKLEFHNQVEVSHPKTQNDTKMAVQVELVKELKPITVKDNKVDFTSSKVSPTSKFHLRSPTKMSTSNEPKNQQNMSGLSFNLVNDDHMGDVFKSLLRDSDNLPYNALPESMLIFGTPEKSVSSPKFENLDSLSENKTPPKDPFSWPLILSPHIPTFPCLETVLNPDVFDENCLLETPTSASSSKSLNGSDDRLKSYSSILLEDLAVSLTVPSPLKSDSHLSFLRPTCATEPILEIDGKCCEGSVLEEEDATEQDIHLTLDSDNSSIGSLEDLGESGSFQYHPSEPMQAVIMEKSNDHFIVKIRRAVSSSSPVSDCSLELTDKAALRSIKATEGNTIEMEPRLDIESEEHNDSQIIHSDHFDLAVVAENCTVDLERLDSVPLAVPENESVFKLPPSRRKPVEIPAEVKQISNDTVEPSGTDTEKNATSCIKETCSPVPPAEILPMETCDANTTDLNLKKKKRKSLDDKPSAKRQKKLSLPDGDKGTKHNIIEGLHLEKSNKGKHKRAVSDGAINVQSSKVSPTNLSAKNVIKKKGEVVVSWTRDEDRAILLECQKLAPTKKTFVFLSSTMNKFPHQVEERFRQLMKLFKKSRNSSS
ncbi:CASP8-associated protein 2 isoform X1 [Ranitomeya variabilis]|uniref:CASP8-associated protein 2 isoform X1 n=1 Tax=Ranitomeya variabilis TaxID=490064 RepID=UPI004056B56F